MTSAGRLNPDAEARALRAVAEPLNRAVGLQAALGRAPDAVMPLVGSETGWIVLLEELGGTRLAVARNLPPGLEAADGMTLQGPCQCLDRLRRGPLQAAAPTTRECDRLRPGRGRPGSPRQHASVPLHAGGTALGSLNLTPPPGRVFTEADLRLLTVVAQQMGVAIDRARLYEAERRRADEIGALARSRQEVLDRLESAQDEPRRRLKDLSALTAGAALLGRSRRTEEGLGRLLDEAMRMTGMEAAEISLLDEASGRQVVLAQRGLSSEWRLARADCLCGWVARQDEPLCLADAPCDPRAQPARVKACTPTGPSLWWWRGGDARLRETDFIARYGGDEFTILLPETDKAGGQEVAGQIRSAVSGRLVRLAGTQPGGRLTVSLGVAAFPEDAPAARELMARADQALYRAKRSGLDRVCTA